MTKTVKIINPAQNELASIKGIKAGEAIARWVAMITTSGGAYLFGVQAAGKYLPDYMAWSAGIAAALVAALLTDHIFGSLLQRVTYNWLASGHPNVRKWANEEVDPYFQRLRQAGNVMYVLLLVGLFVFDIYTTWAIKDPVADSANTTPIINVDSLRQSISAAYTAQLTTLKSDSEARRRSMAEAARRVESQNSSLAALKARGNGWASTIISKKQEKATAGDAKAKAGIDEAYAKLTASAPEYVEQRVQEAVRLNQERNAKNQSTRNTMSTMYLLFSIVPKVLAVFLRCFMVVIFLTYSKNMNPDITGDGIIDYRDAVQFAEQLQQQQQQQQYEQHSRGHAAFR